MNERERNFLGLTHNPFVEPCQGFFERGGRKKYLEQLRHLSQWSRRVLLVTGPEGVGKTTLYRELAATLEPRVKAARISAGLVNTRREVLAAIAQGFGIAAGGRANVQSLHGAVLAHVDEQTRADRPCLVLVDDAQLLENAAVDELMALARESALHLVLFGEVGMVPQVERSASGQGIGWQEIRLSGYDAGDARDYLEWRFAQAKYRGRIPFTDGQIADLIKLSGGLPGRINQMANVLLVKLESGEISPAGRGFPRQHLALLLLICTVIGVLYLMYGEEETLEKVAGGGQQVGSQDLLVSMEAAAGQAGSAPETLPGDDYSEPEPSVHREPPVTDETVMVTQPEREPETAWETAPETITPGVADTSPAGTETADAGLSTPPAEQGEGPDQDAGGGVEDAAIPDVPVAGPETPGAWEPADAKDMTGVHNTRWLLRQNPDYYTLQLLTLSALDRAEAFVARQREPEEFVIYQLQRDGRVLHVVLYGVFSTREAAQVAADELPPEVGDVRPWIRQIGQVQSAARISTLQ